MELMGKLCPKKASDWVREEISFLSQAKELPLITEFRAYANWTTNIDVRMTDKCHEICASICQELFPPEKKRSQTYRGWTAPSYLKDHPLTRDLVGKSPLCDLPPSSESVYRSVLRQGIG